MCHYLNNIWTDQAVINYLKGVFMCTLGVSSINRTLPCVIVIYIMRPNPRPNNANQRNHNWVIFNWTISIVKTEVNKGNRVKEFVEVTYFCALQISSKMGNPDNCWCSEIMWKVSWVCKQYIQQINVNGLPFLGSQWKLWNYILLNSKPNTCRFPWLDY